MEIYLATGSKKIQVERTIMENEIQAASKVAENRLVTPVSVEKLGATNMPNQGYRTVYGGPTIDGEYYLQWTLDSLFQ